MPEEESATSKKPPPPKKAKKPAKELPPKRRTQKAQKKTSCPSGDCDQGGKTEAESPLTTAGKKTKTEGKKAIGPEPFSAKKRYSTGMRRLEKFTKKGGGCLPEREGWPRRFRREHDFNRTWKKILGKNFLAGAGSGTAANGKRAGTAS